MTSASPDVRSLLSLQGKVAIVTGGARGLGYEMMRALAESGADVACIDLLAETGAEAIAKIESDCKVKGSSWGCDVTNEEDVAMVFNQIAEHHGGIDILLTAAGINKTCPAVEYTAKDFRKIFDVNVSGTFFCAQAAAKYMMQTGRPGSIITVASMSAHITNRPQPHAPYNATKAAVLQLTKSLACEWAPHNIRVTAISPGYFDTEMNRTILAQQGEEGVKMRQTWETQTPAGRLGTPHELKGVIVFLASDASTFCTGTEIVVDGGYTAW
ncbi:short-chain dehydrogenase/reductase SDR [Zychaea mexicana]|uniref:short-chain dehydrogenase/reductase SDR n=1 Tax=Zychaea mexicana TaxID=64656 RepID=UPI0022FE1E52|nr:short-chain dehydrogenase/reductase SDR [Zychaea mexicana]KAI9491691.1 short-chain dehydrogenase/reductase SDR [Zychaea mexicana]